MFIRYRKGKLISSGKAFRRSRNEKRRRGIGDRWMEFWNIFVCERVQESRAVIAIARVNQPSVKWRKTLSLSLLRPWNGNLREHFKRFAFSHFSHLISFVLGIAPKCECQQIKGGGKSFVPLSVFPKESSFLNPHLHCNGLMADIYIKLTDGKC